MVAVHSTAFHLTMLNQLLLADLQESTHWLVLHCQKGITAADPAKKFVILLGSSIIL